MDTASTEIVNEMKKRSVGRPRTVGRSTMAPVIAVRLPDDMVAQIEAWALERGAQKSDVVRVLITEAMAARARKAARKAKSK
jgi:hypothetical protein